ncbi:MAG: MFS transporter [Myxococcaceae bacterium]|nr:MAG: MFS transporter [Myxococcaceae bacterium]
MAVAASTLPLVDKSEERRVIFASSLGTVFEWYDFYIYAVLAPFFAAVFFPPGNQTTALLNAFVNYAAGFLVRPFGALFFGRIGDLVGRKYTFLVTITVMGLSTALVGFLPTFSTIGMLAPLLLLLLRLAQGLALGGEYGGAATYVAEHAPEDKRGGHTAWIQTTATLGLFLALVVIWMCRNTMTVEAFRTWGWRIPFILSVILLVVSIYIRLKLNESPMFRRMKEEGKGSKAPLSESFGQWSNLKIVILALLGATAGQGVVWYTGQFYALFFLQTTLKVPFETVYLLIAASLVIGTPFFIVFGRLSDRIGRKWIMMLGCLLGVLTYFPLFKALTHFSNPSLEKFNASNTVTLTAGDCQVHLFALPTTRYSDCDRVRNILTSRSVSYTNVDAPPGAAPHLKINDIEIPATANMDAAALKAYEAKVAAALAQHGYPAKFDPAGLNWPMVLLILVIMVIYVTMVYGPIAAFLVELFPTRIRYTSMSLPYHIGNGWFGGMLPLTATALVAATGDIYYGLWYPIIVAAMTFVLGSLFVRETKDHKIGVI